MTVSKTVLKAGRSYKVSGEGATDVSLKFQVVLAAPLGQNELPTSFAGVPAIGSAHPMRLGYYATCYEVSQPEGAAKSTLDITVKYGPLDETITPGEQGEPDKIDVVTEWGWDDGTSEKDLVSSVAVGNEGAKAVVNSAGDPFEAAPRVMVPTPTFTKVVRSSELKDYTGFQCALNDANVTIGPVTYPAGTLLCTISMRKLIGEWRLPYEYTVKLRYKSNYVTNIYSGDSASSAEVGWDAAVVDAGMRAIDSNTGELKLITIKSAETGEPATVTTPELLDGHGGKMERGSTPVEPINLLFHAYPRVSFQSWMYSEPPTPRASVSTSGGGSGSNT